MNLNQGNQSRVTEDKEKYVPLSVYPEHIIKKLKTRVKETKKSIKNGETPIFDSVESLFEELDR